ncbi:hypothetical protein ACV373_31885, partial [Pseudomonas aeruginosa]
QDLPPAVLARMEELFLDWLGSALAGKGQHPIPLFERYAERMGPADGSAQILPSRRQVLVAQAGEKAGELLGVVGHDQRCLVVVPGHAAYSVLLSSIMFRSVSR